MDTKPISNEAEYREALKLVEKLMAATSSMPEGENLDELITRIEAYESKHYSLDFPDSPVRNTR